MSAIEELQSLGYTVEVARRGDDARPTVYRVEGHGISIRVDESDEDTLSRLTDPAAHRERALQAQEGAEETAARHAEEGRLVLTEDGEFAREPLPTGARDQDEDGE